MPIPLRIAETAVGLAAAASGLTSLLGEVNPLDWIGDRGFPIAVASYLLIRLERELRLLREHIARQTAILEKTVRVDLPDLPSEAPSA